MWLDCFDIYWSTCLIHSSRNTGVFVTLSLCRIRGWCRSSHTAHCISYSGHLHTWVGTILLYGVFLITATNNIVEYMSVISLLMEASTRDISNLVVKLASQLVIMQLKNCYHIRNPTLLRHYLRVWLVECQFEIITYEHIPQEFRLASVSFFIEACMKSKNLLS